MVVMHGAMQDGVSQTLQRALFILRPRKLPTPVSHFCPVVYPKRAV